MKKRKIFGMRLFEKRPLCFACSACLLLCLLFSAVGIYSAVIAAAVSATGLVAALIFKPRFRRTLILLFIAALLVCGSFISYFILSKTAECDGAVIRGYVLPSDNGYSQIYQITSV